jgi:hypothetical protein
VAHEVLEIGKAGSSGVEKGVVPVLRDGVVVARLQASRWKEAASAVVGNREWVFAKQKRELTGRWAADPEGTARLHARQTSAWKGTWTIDLEGVQLEMGNASAWKGTHRYRAGGRVVAESGTTGGWSRRPTLTADDALPLDSRVFLLWLELLIQRRAAGAAAGAAAGGAAAAG